MSSQDNLKFAVFCKFITCIIFSFTEEKKLPLDIKGKQPQSSNLNWQLLLIQKLKEMVFKACFKVSKIVKFWGSLRNLLKMRHKKLEIQSLEGCVALSCCKRNVTSANLCQCIPSPNLWLCQFRCTIHIAIHTKDTIHNRCAILHIVR